MCRATIYGRWLFMLLLAAGLVGTAHAQRNVTLLLNAATIPDTTSENSFMEVRGAVNGVAPITLLDGSVIDWSDASTLEPTNIGGDYWQIQFQIADTTDLTFKFFSQQAEDGGLNGWEADPNPNIPPGTGDTTLTVHYFESQSEYRGAQGDRGDYDWQPFESKPDSVAIWFRVAMFGDESRTDNYDPSADAPAQQIGVRGDDLGGSGPVDWGNTKLVLQRESTNANQPGYNIYSGVGYYPMSLVGTEQNYKFVRDNDVLDDGDLGWEEGNLSGNRTFTVPANDSTLHWVYYGDTVPSAVVPVTSTVLFAVDLSPLETIGVFQRARGDTLEVRGSFNGWDCAGEGSPDDCLLQRVPGEDVFEAAVVMTRIPETGVDYKFFLNFNDETFRAEFGVDPPSGWEEGHMTGIDRNFLFAGTTEQDLGIAGFNDIRPGNIIPDGVSIDVLFEVDMTPALNNAAQPFAPASGDSVMIQIGDPIWAFTQNIIAGPNDGDFPRHRNAVLTDDNADNIYTGTVTVTGPTYSSLLYKYTYGQGSTFFDEPDLGTKVPGRRRLYYIDPNGDGTWPATYVIGPEEFQIEAVALPFESNPVAIEVIDDEVPSRIWLGENYPNPFNPTTTFEYSIDRAQQVAVRVYDMLGRVVATLVDGVQPAATYQVSFDASNLASGVYLYRIETANTVISKRMLLIK
ncbi:MAG: T9SS type A sorting domain-containing protein [Rhodothermales bacterium]